MYIKLSIDLNKLKTDTIEELLNNIKEKISLMPELEIQQGFIDSPRCSVGFRLIYRDKCTNAIREILYFSERTNKQDIIMKVHLKILSKLGIDIIFKAKEKKYTINDILLPMKISDIHTLNIDDKRFMLSGNRLIIS